MHRELRRRPLLFMSLAVMSLAVTALAACSTDDEEARARAEQLVAATEQAGLAPGLTVDVAESLYGDDAAAVCDTFDGGLTSAERLVLLGNPSNRRHKTITDHAAAYAQLVVDTYCPQHSGEVQDVVGDLDPYESDLIDEGSS